MKCQKRFCWTNRQMAVTMATRGSLSVRQCELCQIREFLSTGSHKTCSSHLFALQDHALLLQIFPHYRTER